MIPELRRTNLLVAVCRHLILALAFIPAAYGQPEVRADNTARYAGAGRYDWTVYIVADASALRAIDCVEYTLHPTFTNPKRKVCSGGGKYPFALSESGWGEFNIGIKITFKNGDVRYLDYMLRLKNNDKDGGDAPARRAVPVKQRRKGR